MKPTAVEFRDRSKRAPGGDFRILLGTAETRRELSELRALRELCRRLAVRGEWDVLQAMKARTVTPEAVARLVDTYGTDDYRAHLELTPAAGVPTLDQHVARFLDTVSQTGTRRVYTRGLARLQNTEAGGARLGSLPWHEVHSHHVQDAKGELQASGLASNTIRTYLGAWGGFFTWALQREESEAQAEGRPPLRETNPVRKARTWGKPQTTRHRFLTRDEFHRLLEVTAPPMRAPYATLTLCGLRIEELLVLPPAHVRLPTHLHVGPWGSWVPKGYPRYDHGVRDVPIHQGLLLPLLHEYAEEWAGDRTFFVNPSTGAPMGYHAFTSRFRADVEAAGMVYGQRVAGKRQPDGVTPHTLRHTLASWLAQEDVQLLKIARILGDTEDTVRRHYAHLLPTDLDRTIQRLFPGEDTRNRRGVSSELPGPSLERPETPRPA